MQWWRRVAATLIVMGAMSASTGFPVADAAPSRNADLVALDAATGTARWRAAPTQRGGGFGVLYANASTVFAAQWRCFWMDDGKRASESTALVAFDAKTGRERWRVAGIDSGWSGEAATVPDWVRRAPNGPVPVYSMNSHILRALDTTTGDELWHRTTRDLLPVTASATDIVLVTEPATAGYPQRDPAEVQIIDRRTGNVRAHSTVAGASTGAAVALSNQEIAVPVFRADGTVVAVIDSRTGETRRELSVPATVNGGPLSISTAGGVLVISGGATVGLDARSGAVLWTSTAQDASAISAEVTFARPSQPLLPSFAVLDTMTGAIRWPSPKNTVGYAADAHQTVFVAANLWHAFGPASVVDTTSGATLWTTEFSDDQHLLAAHGSLYVTGGCPPTLAD